jgi:hypothetical protein
MKSLREHMHEYRKMLEKGQVQEAYMGLMDYIGEFKNLFKK